MKKKKKVFIDGAIGPDFIAESIAKHQTKKEIGAHEIFLGQVRADQKGTGIVQAIEFSAHEEMAEEKLSEIRELAFDKFNLSCMHVYHSINKVEAGQICFYVFASSAHRKDCREAVSWLVDTIKKEVPIFGKEILENGQHHWKSNTEVL
ncbi:MAG TPA: molybdopterin converting factor [Flavobacteriales bacterium]|nr:molybdopterin converting factor [Flavobacteriales bacterium]